jgi:hypothetical protein
LGIGSLAQYTTFTLLAIFRVWDVEGLYWSSWKRNGFVVWAECRASRKESRRHSPLELVKDHSWMTLVLIMLSYYHISNHGMDEPITF